MEKKKVELQSQIRKDLIGKILEDTKFRELGILYSVGESYFETLKRLDEYTIEKIKYLRTSGFDFQNSHRISKYSREENDKLEYSKWEYFLNNSV